jgi:hypothetical protein
VRIAVGFAAIAVLAACGAEASPDEASLRVERARVQLGPVEAVVWMAPDAPRFGDRVTFELEVEAGSGAKLGKPDFGARLGHFRVRDRKEVGSTTERRLVSRIVAEPERTGTNIVRWPAIPFRIEDGEGAGEDRELVVPPFEVEVVGLGPDETPVLADLGRPLPGVLPASNPEDRQIFWWFGGAALFVGIALASWLRRRVAGEDAVEPEIDPVVEAARAFDALLSRRLAEQGRFAELYVGLTGIVRRFLERTTGVHAPEQTTEEFLRAMEGNPAFGDARRQALAAFLLASDYVKYAAQVPTGEEVGEAVAAARAFCQHTPTRGEDAA